MRRLLLATLLVLVAPAAAHASFNSAPCSDFQCNFLNVGLLLGVLGGLPLSGVIFIGLHMYFAHPARSKIRQLFLGGFVGLAAFEIAAAAAAGYTAAAHPPGYRGAVTWPVFFAAYAAMAILSVIYARSAPRTGRDAE